MSRALLNLAPPSDGHSSDLHCSLHHRAAAALDQKADTKKAEDTHEALRAGKIEAYIAEGNHELENLALHIQDIQKAEHQGGGGRSAGKVLGMAHSRNLLAERLLVPAEPE